MIEMEKELHLLKWTILQGNGLNRTLCGVGRGQ